MCEINSRLRVLNLARYSDNLKQFVEQCRQHDKSDIENCSSLNELVATCMLKDYKKHFLEEQKHASPKRSALKSIDMLLVKDDVLLIDITNEKLQRIYTEVPEAYRSNFLKFVRDEMLLKALEKGIAVPCYVKNNVAFINMYMRNIAHTKEVNTLQELFAKYWSNIEGSKSSLTALTEDIQNKNLKDLTYDDILSSGTGRYTVESLKSLRYLINRYIIKPAIEDKLLPRNFLDRNKFDELLREHLGSRELIPKEDRTVGWYIFELHKKANTYFSNKKYTFMRMFGAVLEKKAKDLSREDVENITANANARLSYVSAINRIIKDGLCNPDVFRNEEHISEDFCFDDDVWHFSVRSSIDFSDICLGLREPVKHYIWEITSGLKKTLNGGFVNIELLFEKIEKLGVNKVENIDNKLKKKLYLELEEYAYLYSASKSRSMLKHFKRFVRILQNINYEGFNLNISFNPGEIRLPSSTSKINTYTDEEMTKILKFIQESPNRLMACAIGLQALFARRISETVSFNEANRYSGLKVDALRKLGSSSVYALVYESEKQKKVLAVPLSIMVGKREDPFAENLIELGMALFEEALQITSIYRKGVPDRLRNYLFVEPKRHGGYGLLRGGVVRKVFNKFKKNAGIGKEKSFHEFRHTMATGIILSGGSVADAADALGDEVETISSYYHAYAQRHDTIKHFALLGRSEMVMPLEDSEFFSELSKNEHKVVLLNDLEEGAQDVVGGKCSASLSSMFSCLSYKMLNSESGCPGCKSFRVVAYIHTEYWKRQQAIKLREMSVARNGNWWFEKTKAGYEQATNILEELEEKELEHELGI